MSAQILKYVYAGFLYKVFGQISATKQHAEQTFGMHPDVTPTGRQVP
jgi:hypothetical protein